MSQLVENDRILKLSASEVGDVEVATSVELVVVDESGLPETRRMGNRGSVQHRP